VLFLCPTDRIGRTEWDSLRWIVKISFLNNVKIWTLLGIKDFMLRWMTKKNIYLSRTSGLLIPLLLPCEYCVFFVSLSPACGPILNEQITMAEINPISIGIYLVEFGRRCCGGGSVGCLLSKTLHYTQSL
jgi:hypothetical protein